MGVREDIENRIDIVELAGRYMQLKKTGTSYKALCPFHQEKTPSFVISPTKNLAYCFGCHNGGGPIKFLSEIEKIPYGEALQILGKEAGVELKTDFYKERSDKSGDVYEMYRVATQAYHEQIFLDENRSKLQYLLDRGVSKETIERFSLGYSGDPQELAYRLKDKGFGPEAVIEAGLFVSPYKDKFYGRIVFPIANFMGHTVAFTGRIIGQGEPKYLNSPASRIFDKSSVLYGLHLAKQSIAQHNAVIVVEGQMDTVSLHQYGFTNTVGISGTALTKDHVHLLRRLTRKVYLCLDGDKAGIQATFASIENLTNEDMDIFVVTLGPDAKDPDELLKAHGAAAFQDRLEKAENHIDFYLREGRKLFDDSTMMGKKRLVEACLKLVAKVESKIEADIYITAISEKTGLDKGLLYQEMRPVKKQPEGENEESLPMGQDFSFEELLAAYISNYEGFFDLFFQNFRYTDAGWETSPGFSILKRFLAKEELDPTDSERVKAAELQIEEENQNLGDSAIRSKFIDLVRHLEKLVFQDEKDRIRATMDPNSTEYLLAYQSLIEKAKKLGIKTNTF